MQISQLFELFASKLFGTITIHFEFTLNHKIGIDNKGNNRGWLFADLNLEQLALTVHVLESCEYTDTFETTSVFSCRGYHLQTDMQTPCGFSILISLSVEVPEHGGIVTK